MLMFKILILQKSYGLSDEERKYQINDRLSFQRFLGLDLSDNVPDARTIWLYRERLENTGSAKKFFGIFQKYLDKQGLVAHKGVIVDATFVEVPKQRNSKDENDKIKEGKKPEGWSDKKTMHKDLDARWVKKRGQS
jgi:IS5 family transposase